MQRICVMADKRLNIQHMIFTSSRAVYGYLLKIKRAKTGVIILLMIRANQN